MRYSFRIGDFATTWGQQDRDLLDDNAARIEALLFAARVLGDSSSAQVQAGDLTVEARSDEGKLRLIVQILSSDKQKPAFAEDEMAGGGEGHPS